MSIPSLYGTPTNKPFSRLNPIPTTVSENVKRQRLIPQIDLSTTTVTHQQVIEMFSKSKINVSEITDIENARLMSVIIDYNTEISDAHSRLMDKMKSLTPEEIMKIWNNIPDDRKQDLLTLM